MDEAFNDLKLERLRISGYVGDISDAWVDYLKASTGWMSGDSEQVSDLTGLWLEMQGAIGSTINDMWYDLLGQLGFGLSGHLQDRLYDYWSSTDPLP